MKTGPSRRLVDGQISRLSARVLRPGDRQAARPPARDVHFAQAADAHRRALLDGRAGSENETVGEYLEGSWLPAKQGRVEPSTFDQYRWASRRHIEPLRGAVRPPDLTPEFLDSWLVELVAVDASTGAAQLQAAAQLLY